MKNLIIFLGLITVFVLGACNNTDEEAKREELGKTVSEETESTPVVEKEEVADKEEDSNEEEVTQEKDDDWIAYADMEHSSVQYIKDISPNDMAREIEKNPYDYSVVTDDYRMTDIGDEAQYVQRFDLDGDGNEEEIKVLIDGTDSEEYPSFILAIYDSKGHPKYAEYQYNAESLEHPMPILTVAEMTGDNFLEIVMDSTGTYGFMEGNGDQSLGRFVYGFDANIGNFRLLPSLGSYYDIVWQEEIAVQIDERISGLSEYHDYKPAVGEAELEGLVESRMVNSKIIEPGHRFVGAPRRVYTEKAIKPDDSDEQFSLVVTDLIHDIPDLSIISNNLYQWNAAYGWFEVVGSDFSSAGDDTFSFEKELYTPSDFNSTFGTKEREFEDYMGSWQMVVDGKLQPRYLDIEEDVIYEIERDLKDYEQVIEREITIDDYVYKEETGQLIPVGEVKPFSDQPYNASYQNLLTLVEIDDETMLMDQYGHLYGEDDGGDREVGLVDDEEVDSAEADDSAVEDVVEEADQTVSIETSIDVLSPEFMNEYFAGPESYSFDGIEEGMSQTEVENLLGLPEEYYDVEGAEFAIYDNMAVLYSQYFPTRAGAFEHINPDENFVTRTEIFLRVPHEQIVAAYGEPTLSYDEYPHTGPGREQTIYDHTRGNGYAIYIEVGMSGTAWLMTKGEESGLVDEYR